MKGLVKHVFGKPVREPAGRPVERRVAPVQIRVKHGFGKPVEGPVQIHVKRPVKRHVKHVFGRPVEGLVKHVFGRPVKRHVKHVKTPVGSLNHTRAHQKISSAT